MKYNQPFGSSDPDAPYGDRNTPGFIRGSVPPAAAIEDPQREIVGVLVKSGLVPADGDLEQLAKAVRSQKLNYRAAGGSANTLTVTLDPAPASYAELVSVPLRVKIATTNTDAVTLNVNGFGAKPIVRLGSGAAMAPGDLVAGGIYTMTYDGASFQVAGAGAIALQSGASSSAAPKLLNVEATTTSNFTAPGAVNTLLQYQTTGNSNLGTSTFASNRLTIGAGEAGLWYMQASWVFSTTAAANFAAARIRKNGATIVSEVNLTGLDSGGGYVLQTSSILKAAVGDYFEGTGAQQSGTTQTALADSRARFVAMLLSSY